MPDNSTISVCLIVKNEQKNLAACLNSVKEIADEFIIVDTGSEDKTLEIAAEFGAKIFNYQWNNDFSEARNFAIQQAACDWILNLDATHRFKASDEDNLNSVLSKSGHYGYIIHEHVHHNGKNDVNLDRLLLFRNFLGFRFNGVIFEQVDESILNYTTKHWIKEPIGIMQAFYLEKHSEREAGAVDVRNRSILKDAIQKEPDNYYHYFMLLLTLRNLAKNDEYKDILLKAVYRIEQKNPELNESIVGIWGLFGDWVIDGDNTEKLEKFYKNAAVINKQTRWNDIRLVWPYVKVSIMQKKYDRAINDLTRCIENGLVPAHITLTRIERITPVYQLIKLINHTQNAIEFMQFIQGLDSLLNKAGILKDEVISFIRKNDSLLYSELTLDQSLYNDNSADNQILPANPFISLCMIIKNEEVNLEKCLNSVRDVVDEIIIVDTGSTDNGKEIAQKFNAKILSKAWKDDFSDARNAALEAASGEWILQLDADEELTQPSAHILRDLLMNNPADAFNITVRNYQPETDMVEFMDDPQVRIFRNNKKHRYENRVHEQIIPSIARAGGRFSELNIIINHYGYKNNNRQRAERNLPILSKEIKENPDNGYILFKLGETYKALKQWDKAADYLRQALKSSSKNIDNEIKELIYLRLGQIELGRSNFKAALEYAQGCLRFNSKSAMAKYILAIAMMYEGQIQDAMRIFLELKATQKLHKLDLSELDNLLAAINEIKNPEILN